MQFFLWIADNWQAVCAWGMGFYFTYHVVKALASIVLSINAVVKRILAAESTITSMAINHLPHLQLELERNNKTLDKTNEILQGMRGDLQEFMKDEGDDHREL